MKPSFTLGVFFSEIFKVPDQTLKDYGAFNISLINDLPLFIDPFLLYETKPEYQKLHKEILEYLAFLKTKSEQGTISAAQRKSWYNFSEVKQNWLGYSLSGNKGSGLGDKFAKAMSSNIHRVFADLNVETISASSHIEKIGLFEVGIGRDNISDFTCNLIKKYLLEYTETFAKKHIDSTLVDVFMVPKVYFDYDNERWVSKQYTLPAYDNDYVILTPKDLLNKDDSWINSNDLKGDFKNICNSISNNQQRSEIEAFYRRQLPALKTTGKGKSAKTKQYTKQEVFEAVMKTVKGHPEILDYYIKRKEGRKADALASSAEKVKEVEELASNVVILINELINETSFYEKNNTNTSAYQEAIQRVSFLKNVIENKDGWRLFYFNGKPIKREADLQVMYRLTWHASPYDVNRESNNGRGPVDYSISKGSADKALVEFKLASNTKLKGGIEKQVEIYKKAHDTDNSLIVILYFDHHELVRVNTILKELKLENPTNIILIDAGEKRSASAA